MNSHITLVWPHKLFTPRRGSMCSPQAQVWEDAVPSEPQNLWWMPSENKLKRKLIKSIKQQQQQCFNQIISWSSKFLFNHYFEKREDESYETLWRSTDVILTWWLIVIMISGKEDATSGRKVCFLETSYNIWCISMAFLRSPFSTCKI